MNPGPIAIPLLFMACFGLLSYLLLQGVREGLQNYNQVYAQATAQQYEDLFLFIPARRLADIARAGAVLVFILLFLLTGDFTPTGALRGGILGGAAAVGALFVPGVLVRLLRRRRIERFNLQLVDALVSMSSALRAGFSILQAYESVVKQAQNPIAQEFTMFLQQVRVGVRFEDALHNMETRVPSEDLTLMNQSIEIARQTGGNLTEVFEKIAATIRERLRIEQRVRSLTAQGRLQGIVVGAVPVGLLVIMTLLDPGMMLPFFASRIGIGLLVLVAVLELGGVLLIRKIVSIKV